MFAVIKTGGKQYRVAEKDVITIDKVKGAPGDLVEFAEVLVVGGDNVTIGTPTVAGASVAGEVVEQTRGAKVIAFKKRRRKNSRRKRGHRQELSVIRITEILTDGRKRKPWRGNRCPRPRLRRERRQRRVARKPPKRRRPKSGQESRRRQKPPPRTKDNKK